MLERKSLEQLKYFRQHYQTQYELIANEQGKQQIKLVFRTLRRYIINRRNHLINQSLKTEEERKKEVLSINFENNDALSNSLPVGGNSLCHISDGVYREEIRHAG